MATWVLFLQHSEGRKKNQINKWTKSSEDIKKDLFFLLQSEAKIRDSVLYTVLFCSTGGQLIWKDDSSGMQRAPHRAFLPSVSNCGRDEIYCTEFAMSCRCAGNTFTSMMSSLSHFTVSAPACLSAVVLEAGSLLWHWSYSVLVWSGVTHDREEGSIRSSVKEKVKTVWIHSVFQSVCVCVWVWDAQLRLFIYLYVCIFSVWLFVSRAGAWQCFTRAFLWKSECASSALAREVKGRWNRWAVPMGQSWTHRYPGRARGYVASIHETSSRSNKDRLAPDWLSPSRPLLPVGDRERDDSEHEMHNSFFVLVSATFSSQFWLYIT